MNNPKINLKYLKEGNIALTLDSYQDIFSDFDPRHYSKRILSEDFIEECERAVRPIKEKFQLILLLPKNKRNFNEEKIIKQRIKEYFNHRLSEKQKEIKKIKRQGIQWFLIGTIIMIISTQLETYTNFFIKILSTMSIPAGWFSFWEGLGKIFIDAREKIPDYEFYRKMSSAKISFENYK
jgi:vacuolar-type H+-ATPase subunit F/Vma7